MNSQPPRKSDANRGSKSQSERAPKNSEVRPEPEPLVVPLPTDVETLQQLLVEKNELLEVLTERLELAAEQLDRVRRQGGTLEAAPSSKSSTFDDPELSDDLRQMLADWQDLRGRGWFGSLEERLDGLHGLVSQLRFEPASRGRTDDDRPKSVADVLANHGFDPSSLEDAPPAGRVSASAEETSGKSSAEALQLPEPPAPLDIDNGSTQELRDGLRAREEYIVRLKDYLVAMDAAHQLPSSQPDLGILTADQRQALEDWEATIRKEIRQTQIQLWIERAQLSREQMRISQMEHHLETETRRLGLVKQRAAGIAAHEPPVADPNKGKNWLGLFGGK